MRTMRHHVLSLATLAALLNLLTACPSGDSLPWDHDVSPFARHMVESDLDNIRLAPRTSCEPRDRAAFEQIFGGTSGRHVADFVRSRVSHYMQRDASGLRILASQKGVRLRSDFLSLPDRPEVPSSDYTLAKSVSTEVYYLARVNGHDLAVQTPEGEVIEVSSTRPGIIEVPRYYLAVHPKIKDVDPDVRRVVRQEILVHEARHADCGGGIHPLSLAHARGAASYRDFYSGVDVTCGHLHSLCPPGDYHDLPACDAHEWGAYSVGAIFAEQARHALGDSPVRDVLDMMQRDTLSRLTFDSADLLAGRASDPDLGNEEDLTVGGEGNRE